MNNSLQIQFRYEQVMYNHNYQDCYYYEANYHQRY